jgi:ribonuclease P protein subunit RPR2
MKFKKAREKDKQENIASERISRLMALAEKHAKEGKLKEANALVERARAIGTRTKTRMPKELKNKYCKHCHAFLIPGRTSRTRINSQQKRVETTCLTCGGRMLYQLGRKQKS